MKQNPRSIKLIILGLFTVVFVLGFSAEEAAVQEVREANSNQEQELEKKDQTLTAGSVEQLVELIREALKENDSQQMEKIKSQNIQLVSDDRMSTTQKCGSLLDKAIKEEVDGEKNKADANFHVCRVLAELYLDGANSRYLLDKVSLLQNLSRERKGKYLKAVELFKKGEKLRHGYKYDEAIKCYGKSISLCKEINYEEGKANSILRIGSVYRILDEGDIARQQYEAALVIYRNIKSRLGEAHSLFSLGVIHLFLAEYETARQHYEQALFIYREIKDSFGEGNCLQALGDVYWMLSEVEKARQRYEEALGISREVKDRLGEASCLRNLGDVYGELSDYRKSRQLYEEALIICREINARLGEANCLQSLGHVHDRLAEYEKAQRRYNEALKIFQEIKHRLGEANCLQNLGNLCKVLVENEKARNFYEKALKIYREIKHLLGEGNCLQSLGDIHMNLSQYEEARLRFKKSLGIFREVKERQGEANSLLRTGDVYRMLSEYEKAQQWYKDALIIYCEINNRLGEADSLESIGDINWILDRYKKAQHFYERALSIYREISHRRGEANCLRSLGDVHRMFSEYEKAQKRYGEALAICREIKHRLGEANCLKSLGDIHWILSDYEKARQLYEEGLIINRDINNRHGKAYCLRSLGDVYRELSEYEKARRCYEEGLIIYQEIRHRLGEANCLQSLGIVHMNLSEYGKANQRYEEGLIIYRNINHRVGEAYCLQNLGNVNRMLDDYRKSLQYCDESLETQKKIGDKYGMLYTYFYTGKTYEAIKNNEDAQKNYKNSIQLIEEVWSQMKVEDFKTKYFSSKIFPYESLIGLLFKQKKGEIAFQYAERSKARTFLYLLGNKRINPQKGVSQELVREEEELRQKIAIMTFKIRKNQEKEKNRRTSSEKLKAELLQLKQKHSEIIESMKLQSPEYASLKSINPLTVEEIQGLIRQDNDSILLEYYTTEKATYLWVLDGKNIYPYKIDISEKELSGRVRQFRTLLADANSGPGALTPRARKLYKILLEPIEKHIWGKDRIALVPHGILHYLPFEALMNKGKFLSEQDIRFFYLPSASVYKYCREKNSLKKDQLMAIANPDGTLPYSEKEVKEIKNLYPQNAKIFFGKDAKESTIRENALYPDILHFACHGKFDPDHPLYSALVLAPDSNDDGRLEVNEIFNLKLKPAYIVTMSSCETKLGGILRGDEIVGLSRAFIYAGTPSIVASLWKVDDESTARFMTAFYRALKSKDKIEALDIARKTMIREHGKRHPFYWAAFVLIGDPR